VTARPQLRPVRTEADYQAALSEIDDLIDADPGTESGDRLEVLSLLVEAYEQENYPIGPPDPVEAIKFRMEQEGLTRKDLEPILGSRARVSEVLAGKRGLSLRMIRRLNEVLGIPLESLIQEPSAQTNQRPRSAEGSR
jgi:HTH-type transcriptional regulator/antitoxin HigA